MSIEGINVSTSVYASYAGSAETKTKTEETQTTEEAAGAVYEKSEESESKSATYTINKMSAEDRAALVEQLKADQESRKNQLFDLVQQTISGQLSSFGLANSDDEDSVWKLFANGISNVDEAAIAQAKEDISEDGYWGVKQTSQRLFDFASALAGDDVDTMKQMQEAMMKGYSQATSTWGTDLPDISQETIDAANQLFEDYYASKEAES